MDDDASMAGLHTARRPSIPPRPRHSNGSGHPHAMRCLLIEDDIPTAELIREGLAEAGHQV
ncbi:hypothetical protein M1717_26230, partial [Salmonella enterica subsp. enterica serovar Pomona]|uniref:hypothetical protein n=1 Tax=Salmonella enterica TaxID=28901 RepID=UPI0021B45EFF